MYPTIYHLIKDLFGIEICILQIVQSFGFFVALAFIAANYLFGKELKRKEEQGFLKATRRNGEIKVDQELKINYTSLAVGFVLGYKFFDLIMNSCEMAGDFRPYLFSAQGNIIGGVIGAVLYVAIYFYDKKKHDPEKIKKDNEVMRPYQHVGTMTMLAAGTGLFGAKLFHLLENPDQWADLFSSVDNFFSGLTMYGGLLLGSATVIWYANRHKLSIPHLIDACAPGLMLAYGIGRIGCQVSGDGDWGIDNPNPQPEWLSWLPEWTWSFKFPHNVINADTAIPGCEGNYCYELANAVYPTAFYEAIMSIALFAILWSIRKKITIPGALFAIYLTFNGIERFFIEKIRINNPHATIQEYLGVDITQAEIISTCLVFVGIGGYFFFKKKHENGIQDDQA